MRRVILMLFLTFIATYVAFGEVNQEMIDRVEAGEITEARASWWGFDAEDSTEALQAAIDSGVPKLIVENMGSPWIVTPIQLASDQEIIFEEEVEVLAKRGEFHGLNDALFSARGVENLILRGEGAIFRMWREDYDNPELYKKASWRHCLFMGGCTNVQIYGLTLTESGGDGMYLGSGPGRTPNRDIVINGVTCDANYRQGISVTNAENLLIENTTLSNTRGTPPEAGIDFEPNDSGERLVNIVMRDCLSTGNNASGYIVAVPGLNAESEPISFRFENCRSINDGSLAAWVAVGGTLDESVTGTVEFVGCTFEGSGSAGLTLAALAEREMVRVEDCAILDCATEVPVISPIMFESRPGGDAPIGGAEFLNVSVRDSLERPPMGYNDRAGGLALRDVTGTLILERDGERTEFALTEEQLAKWMPSATMTDIPRVSIEGMTLEPIPAADPVPPEEARWPIIRGPAEYLLYADAGDEVSFVLDYMQTGRYGGKEISVTVTSPSGEEVCRVTAPFQEQTQVAFTAAESGVHRVNFNPGTHRCRLVNVSHPTAALIGEKPLHLLHGGGEFSIYVPAGTEIFGVRVAGEGANEAIRATLLDPSGEVFGEVDNQFSMHQFEVRLERPSEGEVWTLRLRKPTDTTWEDHYLEIRGVPPLLAPAGAPLLAPAGD